MTKARRITVSGKIDLRSLATIVSWLHKNKLRPDNKSEALHMTVEALAEMIISSGGGKLYTEVGEAIAALEVYGLDFSPDKRTKQGRELFRAITLPSLDSPQGLARQQAIEDEFEDALQRFKEGKTGEGKDEI